MSLGTSAIARERERQLIDKGYTLEHDLQHGPKQLIDAALAYAMQAQDAITGPAGQGVGDDPLLMWPWDEASFSQSDDELRSLAKAGALIAAAYDAVVARKSGG